MKSACEERKTTELINRLNNYGYEYFNFYAIGVFRLRQFSFDSNINTVVRPGTNITCTSLRHWIGLETQLRSLCVSSVNIVV